MFTGIRSSVKTVAVIAAAVVLIAASGMAEEMDPLLKLLVAKGVITQEEAVALQAESKGMAEAPEPVPAPAPVGEKESWTDKVKFGGDIRLRYEGMRQDDNFDGDRRDRFRIRLRAGVKAEVTDWMTVGIQLRNGDKADPVSNNTSFDGGFQFKDFNLSEGYLQMRSNDGLGAIIGKFSPKGWWTVSDFQWDGDVTPEGILANTGLVKGGGAFNGLDLVAYGYLLEENKSESDARLFGGQLRSGFDLGGDNSLKLGVGFDAWDNPQYVVDLTQAGTLKGNKVTNLLDENGLLVSDFEILNLFAEYKNSSSKTWPVKFTVFYYRNLGAEGLGEDNDTGFFGRIQVGEAKKPWRKAFRYTYYYSEPDALFYVFTNSDTSFASDAEAHRFDFQLGFIAKSMFNFTWYNSKPVYKESETVNRWQLDYIVKF